MRRELYVSAGLHIALLLWVAFGDILFHRNTETDFQVTGVQIISTAEFEELTQAASLPPAPEPTPDPAPQPEVQPQSPEISAPPLGAEDAPPSDTPTPEAAPRVAPTPAPAPPPDAEIAPTVVEATPEPDTQSETPFEQEVTQAPEAATTQIVTEAETPAASLAPIASPVPTARPQRPTPEPTPEPEPQPEPEPEPAPETADPLADAIAAVVADAVSAPATPSVPSGPPLSSGEVDGLIADVRACWNVGALSSEAQRTIVTIAVTLGQDGRPDAGSIRMIDSSGGSDASVSQAFEAGRRAILRCGANGFNLPPEKYDQWQTIEMVFNPEQMRLR